MLLLELGLLFIGLIASIPGAIQHLDINLATWLPGLGESVYLTTMVTSGLYVAYERLQPPHGLKPIPDIESLKNQTSYTPNADGYVSSVPPAFFTAVDQCRHTPIPDATDGPASSLPALVPAITTPANTYASDMSSNDTTHGSGTDQERQTFTDQDDSDGYHVLVGSSYDKWREWMRWDILSKYVKAKVRLALRSSTANGAKRRYKRKQDGGLTNEATKQHVSDPPAHITSELASDATSDKFISELLFDDEIQLDGEDAEPLNSHFGLPQRATWMNVVPLFTGSVFALTSVYFVVRSFLRSVSRNKDDENVFFPDIQAAQEASGTAALDGLADNKHEHAAEHSATALGLVTSTPVASDSSNSIQTPSVPTDQLIFKLFNNIEAKPGRSLKDSCWASGSADCVPRPSTSHRDSLSWTQFSGHSLVNELEEGYSANRSSSPLPDLIAESPDQSGSGDVTPIASPPLGTLSKPGLDLRLPRVSQQSSDFCSGSAVTSGRGVSSSMHAPKPSVKAGPGSDLKKSPHLLLGEPFVLDEGHGSAGFKGSSPTPAVESSVEASSHEGPSKSTISANPGVTSPLRATAPVFVPHGLKSSPRRDVSDEKPEDFLTNLGRGGLTDSIWADRPLGIAEVNSTSSAESQPHTRSVQSPQEQTVDASQAPKNYVLESADDEAEEFLYPGAIKEQVDMELPGMSRIPGLESNITTAFDLDVADESAEKYVYPEGPWETPHTPRVMNSEETADSCSSVQSVSSAASSAIAVPTPSPAEASVSQDQRRNSKYLLSKLPPGRGSAASIWAHTVDDKKTPSLRAENAKDNKHKDRRGKKWDKKGENNRTSTGVVNTATKKNEKKKKDSMGGRRTDGPGPAAIRTNSGATNKDGRSSSFRTSGSAGAGRPSRGPRDTTPQVQHGEETMNPASSSPSALSATLSVQVSDNARNAQSNPTLSPRSAPVVLHVTHAYNPDQLTGVPAERSSLSSKWAPDYTDEDGYLVPHIKNLQVIEA